MASGRGALDALVRGLLSRHLLAAPQAHRRPVLANPRRGRTRRRLEPRAVSIATSTTLASSSSRRTSAGIISTATPPRAMSSSRPGRTLRAAAGRSAATLRSFVAPESLFIDIMMNVGLVLWAANVRPAMRAPARDRASSIVGRRPVPSSAPTAARPTRIFDVRTETASSANRRTPGIPPRQHVEPRLCVGPLRLRRGPRPERRAGVPRRRPPGCVPIAGCDARETCLCRSGDFDAPGRDARERRPPSPPADCSTSREVDRRRPLPDRGSRDARRPVRRRLPCGRGRPAGKASCGTASIIDTRSSASTNRWRGAITSSSRRS